MEHRQKFYVDAERYVASYNELDPDKMRYVVETNRFYDRCDLLIKLTRRTVLLSSVQPSLYEASLADCQQIVTLVAQFIDGTISDTTFGQKINSL